METVQCKHCGTQNDISRALCENCQSPLTAYAGQLRGESYRGNLSAQVDRLRVRPISVTLMVVFLIIIIVGWPLREIFSAFASRATLNSESTNYIASAFGAIGPILVTMV